MSVKESLPLTREEGQLKLVTLLQISDLHFGDIDPSTGGAVSPTLVGIHKVIDGLLGHDINSLKRVSRFWINLRNTEQVDTALVVTGDLTTVGKFAQYTTADTYLAKLLDLTSTIPHLPPLGLAVADWKERGIPGNHDHYPGGFKAPNYMFGRPPKNMRRSFLDDYPKISSMKLKSGHVLKFLLIDTDADIWSTGSDRLYARGHFTSHLDKLAKDPKLGDPEMEIRVLCLHHSPAHGEYELGIDPRSRRALNDFIVQQNIAVLLTGHKHTPPLIQTFPAEHLTISRTYLEARCGTTTQQSTLGFSTSTLTRRRPERPDQMPNILLVHRLHLEDGDVYWQTKCFFEIPTGFKEKSYFRASPKIQALPVADSFKVYPLTV